MGEAVTIGLSTLLLAIVQPLSLISLGLVLAGWGGLKLWQAFRGPSGLRKFAAELPPLLVFGAIAVPWSAYLYWTTKTHPVIAAWTAQNQTPSPPVWDYLIAYGPAILLLLRGVRSAWKGGKPNERFLLVWVFLNAMALYLPLPFQRRLTLGLFFPLAALAIMGLRQLIPSDSRRWWTATLLLLALALPTNLLIMVATLKGYGTERRWLYLTTAETSAFTWLRQNVPSDALVLTGAETGLFLPAYAGQRVLYGHPFETPDAETRRAEVERFFSYDLSWTEAQVYLDANGVNYIFVGPRELQTGALLPISGLRAAYVREGVAIYAVSR